jgi:hypothetical protein
MTQVPEQSLAPAPARPYGTDTARVLEDYPDFVTFAFPLGDHGARAKDENGRITGSLLTAMSLDELAVKMDAYRKAMAGE